MSTRFLRFQLLAGTILGMATVQAATNNFIVPEFRGLANSQSGYWENFTVPYGAPGNAADQPGSTTSAIVTQIGSPSAFATGSGNIYDITGVMSFELTDETPFALGTVVLQIRTIGSELDYDGVTLNFQDALGTHSLEPVFTLELDRGVAMGATVSSLFQWDLRGLNVTDYTLSFAAADASLSLDSITLDTYEQFLAVPEPSTVAVFALGALLLAGCRRAGRSA